MKSSVKRNPAFHHFLTWLPLRLNYDLIPRRTRIRIEGLDHLPRRGGAFLLMNHTDRYTCWPLQFWMLKHGYGCTTAWVKAKYFENPILRVLLGWSNCLEIPSLPWIIEREYHALTGRKPRRETLSTLKRWIDAETRAPDMAVPSELRELEDILTPEGLAGFRARVCSAFDEAMARVTAETRHAIGLGLKVIVFPEGTRSKRLGQGRTGAARMILATGAPVIPIGCSGADRLYPGALPWSHGGEVTYRIGAPLKAADFLSTAGQTTTNPFGNEDPNFVEAAQRLTDTVMVRINGLVDPVYRNPALPSPS